MTISASLLERLGESLPRNCKGEILKETETIWIDKVPDRQSVTTRDSLLSIANKVLIFSSSSFLLLGSVPLANVYQSIFFQGAVGTTTTAEVARKVYGSPVLKQRIVSL